MQQDCSCSAIVSHAWNVCLTLTGNITAPCVDAVSVAAVLGGVHRKAARQWYASLNAKEWSAAFTPGQSHIKLAVGNSGTELAGGTESAVGNPETDLTALPDTLPVVADVAETSCPARDLERTFKFRHRLANG